MVLTVKHKSNNINIKGGGKGSDSECGSNDSECANNYNIIECKNNDCNKECNNNINVSLT